MPRNTNAGLKKTKFRQLLSFPFYKSKALMYNISISKTFYIFNKNNGNVSLIGIS